MIPTSNACGSEAGGGSLAEMMHVPIHNNGESKRGGGDSDFMNGESHLKKGPWTAEEDAKLVEYVRKHGEGNWNSVQRHSGLSRCGKSCRLRWANHLRPNLKKGAFSPEEERLIIELHAKFGNKWARMATLLPGRTDNEIKNYWNTRIKRHQRQGLPLYPPDIQPQPPPSPHFHHQHHHLNSPASSITPSASISSFSFQTNHLPTQNDAADAATSISATPPPLSPATSTSFPTLPPCDFSQPQHQTHHHQHQNNNNQPYTHHPHHHHHSSHTTPTTPTSSFSFQTQLTSPSHVHPHTTPSSTPPPLSPPISSPSHTALPLFDFTIPRTPPILQTPMRFKRFSSTPNIAALVNNNPTPTSMISPNSHFSLPLSPLPPVSASNSPGHHVPSSFTSFLNSRHSSSDFHNELHKENQEMCSLLAGVTQPELPSSQLLSTNQNRNLGIGILPNGGKFGRRALMKKRTGNSFKDKFNGKLGFSLEDLLQEAKVLTECEQNPIEQSGLILQEQRPKPLTSDGFSSHWDQSNYLALSPGMEAKVEVADQLNTIPEDLTKILNIEADLYSDSADISNGQSSGQTDEDIGFDMQQISSLFPPTDQGRTLGSCSWDNLPGIC